MEIAGYAIDELFGITLGDSIFELPGRVVAAAS
jgi:hypothetical protein